MQFLNGHLIYFQTLGPVATWSGVLLAAYGVWKGRKEIRKGFAPVLVAEFNTASPIDFHSPKGIIVVNHVSIFLKNDGNGPAVNIDVEASQGALHLTRAVDPGWAVMGGDGRELHRTSLARGELMESYFTVEAGYTPPAKDSPLMIKATCDNVYGQRFEFLFTAPATLTTAYITQDRRLRFISMSEVRRRTETTDPT